MAMVVVLGVAGGAAGTLAAAYQQVRYGPLLLLPVLVGPAIEEVCKPIGVIFMLEKRPWWLRSGRQVAALAVLGGLVFATLENLLYVYVYHPRGGGLFVFWRWVICTALHAAASGVFGVGLAKMWRHIRDHGGTFDIDVCFRYYVAAVAIHAVYNTSMMVLAWTGVLRLS